MFQICCWLAVRCVNGAVFARSMLKCWNRCGNELKWIVCTINVWGPSLRKCWNLQKCCSSWTWQKMNENELHKKWMRHTCIKWWSGPVHSQETDGRTWHTDGQTKASESTLVSQGSLRDTSHFRYKCQTVAMLPHNKVSINRWRMRRWIWHWVIQLYQTMESGALAP